MTVKFLTIGEVKAVAHALAKELMSWDEPIPDFDTRFPHALESCLATPFIRFKEHDPYPTLEDKGAILFYLMNKNHPFENGNKRIAITALILFLWKNKKWIRVDNRELYNFSKWVAASNPKLKDQTIAAIKKFLELYVVSL
ncbi:MAG: type II toxin-antitoxin system death-on-curing family toxin [Patescibacteria group bacterium]|jgi:death-on-curing protein